MPLAPHIRDRLMGGVAQLIRAGRHLGAGAAAQLHGDLPSFGWALLLPLEHEGPLRCSAVAARAGIDVSEASRQLATLERSGQLQRDPDPRDGRASLVALTDRGVGADTGDEPAAVERSPGSGVDAALAAETVRRPATDDGGAVRGSGPAPADPPRRRPTSLGETGRRRPAPSRGSRRASEA